MKPALFFAAIFATFVVGFAVGRVSVTGAASTPAPTNSVPNVAMAEAPPEASGSLAGVVREVIQVPNYTYLRLATSGGDVWAAVNADTTLREGQQVRVVSAMEMSDFTSKTLGRTFASIWFGDLEGSAAMPAGHPTVAEPSSEVVKALEAATDALPLRVVDVYSEREALAGKRVRVEGTAAKVTEVGGAYYVHVKDGSGAPGSDDLTVITRTAVRAEQPLTVEGTVALNRDVGMGVPYAVVVDQATVLSH